MANINLNEARSFILENFAALQNFDLEHLYFRHQDQCQSDLDEDLYEKMQEAIGADWVRWGCSKIVFGWNNQPFVVKIPFHGVHDWSDYNHDIGEYVDDLIDKGTEDFCYASYQDETSSWDYCEKEAYMYERAIEYKIEEVFAGTWFVCNYLDLPFYVSEKVSGRFYWADAEDSVSEDQVKEASQLNRDWVFEHVQVACVIKDFGSQVANLLMAFIQDYGLRDFHSNNVAIDENGCMRLIDYSGYDEDV